MRKAKFRAVHLPRILPWVSLIVTCTTLWFIFSENIAALFAWESIAFIYVLSVFVVSWHDAKSVGGDGKKRSKSWAWWLPLITSFAGVSAAIIALSANAASQTDIRASAIAGTAAWGVILSWFMLHIGFADVYAHAEAKHEAEQLSFPETAHPKNLDYLYFSLTVGATFAASDVTVKTTRMRGIVTLHAVISFLYNALIVAVVFQVLQQIVTTAL